jgi:hypothetical protein
MTLFKIHSDTPYASRAGEFYRRQRDKKERPYVCAHPNCGACFYIKSQLTAHNRKHTGENPFACAFCTYCAKQKILLDKHCLREHGIPLPSTRLSRHKYRTELKDLCGYGRQTMYTGKVPKQNREGLNKRIHLYRNNPNILGLLTTLEITKKEFYADKSGGYITDHWVVYAKANTRMVHIVGNSQRKTEKIANFMNQINNLCILFPSPADFACEMESLKQDNKKSIPLVNKAYTIYQDFQQTLPR